MIKPIDTADQYTLSGTETASSARPVEVKPNSPAPVDTVTISPEAIQRFHAEMANSAMLVESEKAHAGEQEESPWKLPSGKTHAERTLKNGHTEVIDMDGGTLSIREYDGDRLVKSVDGAMSGGLAVLDTTYYDKSGEATQTIHAELAQLPDAKGWSFASMSRTVQWYENGKTTRTLSDEMMLQTRNAGENTVSLNGNNWTQMTGKMDGNGDELLASLSREEHRTNYYANVQEFHENGKLARNAIIEQSGEFAQESNRTAEKIGVMEPMTTRELSHDTELSVNIWDYDEDGNMLRQATVTDAQQNAVDSATGSQTQTADVSWYHEGEIVKRGHGSFSIEETEERGLMHRPGILDLLGLDAEDYLTKEAQDATELLGRKALDSSSNAGFFLEGLDTAVAKGWYGTASTTAKYGSKDRPYSADWTTELYEDGEMVMRKKDSEGAVDAPGRGVDDRLPFNTVAGLSDGDRPVTLERTEHSVELLENGKVKAMESQKTREYLQPSQGGPETLMTLAGYEKLNDEGRDMENVYYRGGLDQADPDGHAATRSMGAEFDLTMDAVHELYQDIRGGLKPGGHQDSIVRYAPLDS